MLIPDLSVFFQRLGDDLFQFSWDFGVQAYGLSWRAVENRIENGSGCLTFEREKPGRHFVKQHTEGKQVGASIKRLAQYLLRRHVGNCSQSRSGTGEVFVCRAAG